MKTEEGKTQRIAGQRSHVECRACPVVCEWVVHPIHCLRSGCRYVYALEEHGTVFFGCVEGVFAAELDLAAYHASPRKDVYGALKAVRRPLPECLQHVERAYEFLYRRRECRNPTFGHHPHQYSPEAVRELVHGSGPERCPSGPGQSLPVPRSPEEAGPPDVG